jgi:hypothetical protein
MISLGSMTPYSQWLKYAGTVRNGVPGPLKIDKKRSGVPQQA